MARNHRTRVRKPTMKIPSFSKFVKGLVVCVVVFMGIILCCLIIQSLFSEKVRQGLQAQHNQQIISGASAKFQYLAPDGITNWVVVTNYTLPGGLHQVIVTNKEGGCLPSYSSIPVKVGTTVRLLNGGMWSATLIAEPVEIREVWSGRM